MLSLGNDERPLDSPQVRHPANDDGATTAVDIQYDGRCSAQSTIVSNLNMYDVLLFLGNDDGATVEHKDIETVKELYGNFMNGTQTTSEVCSSSALQNISNIIQNKR